MGIAREAWCNCGFKYGMGRQHGAYKRPQGPGPTPHLLVGNCGPAPDSAAIQTLFSHWDPHPEVTLVGSRGLCFVSLRDASSAAAACQALNGTMQAGLPGSGALAISYADRRDENRAKRATDQPGEPPLVTARNAAECGIPGLASYADFVSEAEEAALLSEVEAQPHWQALSRRRVLHFGHVFDYEVGAGVGGRQAGLAMPEARPVEFQVHKASARDRRSQLPSASPAHRMQQQLPSLPPTLQTRGVGAPLHPIPPQSRRIAERIQQLPGAVSIDQLTVNEYACGVGISPHVGERWGLWPSWQPVFRCTQQPSSQRPHRVRLVTSCQHHRPHLALPPCPPRRPETHSAFTGAIASLSLGGPAVMVLRRSGHEPKAVFLPPRSLLVLAGERCLAGGAAGSCRVPPSATAGPPAPAAPTCCFAGTIAQHPAARPAASTSSRPLATEPASLPCRSAWPAGEARYAWQHYIPHRKSDLAAPACGEGPPELVPRAARRVSFTFRQARPRAPLGGPRQPSSRQGAGRPHAANQGATLHTCVPACRCLSRRWHVQPRRARAACR